MGFELVSGCVLAILAFIYLFHFLVL